MKQSELLTLEMKMTFAGNDSVCVVTVTDAISMNDKLRVTATNIEIPS